MYVVVKRGLPVPELAAEFRELLEKKTDALSTGERLTDVGTVISLSAFRPRLAIRQRRQGYVEGYAARREDVFGSSLWRHGL